MELSQLASRLRELPDQTIIYHERGGLVRKSYPEMWADVERFIARLEAWGVEPGMRLGIVAENCYEWLLYELAVLKLGCVSVCFPTEEFASVATDDLAEKYALHLLFVSAKARSQRSEERTWIVVLDRDDEVARRVRHPVGERSETNRDIFSLDPDVFTLVFSSGTSGKLKCILLSKRGTEEMITAFGKHYAFKSDDGIFVVLPLSNYQQRLMVYTAIWHGFDLLLTDPLRFFHGLKEMRPTILGGPPMFFETVENRFRSLPPTKRALLTVGGRIIHALRPAAARGYLLRKWFAPFHDAFGGRIRIMLTGSAPSRHSTLELFDLLGLPLYQAYGLTETGGFVSWNLPERNRPGSVGKLLFEGAVKLADDGEVIVRYDVPRSHGYLYCDEDDERQTYLSDNRIATGDIGRFDEDGYLYIVGRKKQIIITQGGYKIQPESLEREIEQAPDVARAVVFGGGELTGLVALVALRPESDGQAELRVRALVDELNHAVPAPSQIGRVVFTTTQFRVDNGFLTRNLKVDRRAVYEAFRQALVGAG